VTAAYRFLNGPLVGPSRALVRNLRWRLDREKTVDSLTILD
jgi:hypothetical protein